MELELKRTLEQLPQAKDALNKMGLAEEIPQESIDAAKTIVCEIISNAVKFGLGDWIYCRYTYYPSANGLAITHIYGTEPFDSNPPLPDPLDYTEGGRGLAIVRSKSRWCDYVFAGRLVAVTAIVHCKV